MADFFSELRTCLLSDFLTVMSFLLSFPEVYLVHFVSLWLFKKEIGKIDCALCCKTLRPVLLDLFSHGEISIKGGLIRFASKDCVEYIADNKSFAFLVWLTERNLRMTRFYLKVDRFTTQAELTLIRGILSNNLLFLKVECFLRKEYGDEEDKNIDFSFMGSEVEDGLVSLLNSCTNLKILLLSKVPDETLVKINKPAAFSGLTSIELRDSIHDEYFFDGVNDVKNVIPFMLTPKMINHLSGMCHNLTNLFVESSVCVEECDDEVWNIRCNDKDLAKLIRSNPNLTSIHFGRDEDMFSLTGSETLKAIAETCIQLKTLIVFDSSKTNILFLADIVAANTFLRKIKLIEPNYELKKEFEFYRGPKRSFLPKIMHEYIKGKTCTSVTINHLGTTGQESCAWQVVMPGEKVKKRKDVHKLRGFFSKVVDVHQIILVALSNRYSRIDNDCEMSTDVTDRDICQIAVSNPTLVDLQLNGCGQSYTPRAFHTLFMLCKELKHLELGQAEHLSCADLLTLFSVPNTLHRVYITQHHTFTLECAVQIVAQCPCLLELVVENCRLLKEGETKVGQCVVKCSFKRTSCW